MPYVIAAEEPMAAASADLATIGSSLRMAHTQAAAPTVVLVPAAADEVSAGIAQLFSRHAERYQALAGHAAAFHERFAHNLTASARSYASTEGANASSLWPSDTGTGSPASANAAGAIQSLHADIRGFLWQLMSQLLPVTATFADAMTLLLLYLTGRWGLITLFLLVLRIRALLHQLGI
ncbi:PE-PGRS family protein [Mycobacterium tuberculosis]|nr:PE-PGRS family protein [Mycobacterium tuberculosis]